MKITESDKGNVCFACGVDNPTGLKLHFRYEDGKARAEFVPQDTHQSWLGVFHGGLLTTVLDEAMGYVMYFEGLKGMTAKMEVRFKQTVRTGDHLHISAGITRRTRKLIETHAAAETDDGTVVAEANGTMYIFGSHERPIRV